MENLTWKDVFNCYNLFPANIYKCAEKAREVGYGFMAFNGLVYAVNTLERIGLEINLEKQQVVTTVTNVKPQSEIDFIKRIEKISKELQDSLKGRGR